MARRISLGTARSGARQRFESWLSASPEHVRAYLEVSGVWETVSAGQPGGAPDAKELIALAMRDDKWFP